jgi:hypothetical protein
MGVAFTTIEFQTPGRFPVNASPQHTWQRNYMSILFETRWNWAVFDFIWLIITENGQKARKIRRGQVDLLAGGCFTNKVITIPGFNNKIF